MTADFFPSRVVIIPHSQVCYKGSEADVPYATSVTQRDGNPLQHSVVRKREMAMVRRPGMPLG